MSKASKHRQCPALGHEISVPDCGGGRHSKIACAAGCEHNPFAPENYERMLEIEDRIDRLAMERVGRDPVHGANLLSEMDRVARMGPHAENALVTWRLFFNRDPSGNTFAQSWEQAGWEGLKNDERVLMRGKMQMRVALVEIHRVLPGGWVEGVDLLSAQREPFRIRDNSMFKTAVRFTTLLAWAYPAPHFWRLNGTAAGMPKISAMPAEEILREIARHLGGPDGEAEMRRWLAENFHRVTEALYATGLARRAQMFAAMDAKWGQAVYQLQASSPVCRRHLDGVGDVSPDNLADGEKDEGFTAARVWFDTHLQPAGGGQVVLGRVLIGKKSWRVEAMGAEKLARLRALLEERMGERVRFVSERLDDVGMRESLKAPDYDAGLVPPRLLENPREIRLHAARIREKPADMPVRDYMRKLQDDMDRGFLDANNPGLDNRTPREAAGDPLLRPRLVQMMKERVCSCDEANLKNGGDDSIDWMLRELGLGEILFEAPPRREPPDEAPAFGDDDLASDDDDDFEDDDYPLTAAAGHRRAGPKPGPAGRPPAPPLPAAPLGLKEADRRLKKAMDAFETASEAMDEIYESGSTMLDDVEQIAGGRLGSSEYALSVVILMQAWFAMVPQGCRAPKIDVVRLEDAFSKNLSRLQMMDSKTYAKQFERILAGYAQPGLMTVLLEKLFSAAKADEREPLINIREVHVIMALVAAVVGCLDEALRAR